MPRPRFQLVRRDPDLPTWPGNHANVPDDWSSHIMLQKDIDPISFYCETPNETLLLENIENRHAQWMIRSPLDLFCKIGHTCCVDHTDTVVLSRLCTISHACCIVLLRTYLHRPQIFSLDENSSARGCYYSSKSYVEL